MRWESPANGPGWRPESTSARFTQISQRFDPDTKLLGDPRDHSVGVAAVTTDLQHRTEPPVHAARPGTSAALEPFSGCHAPSSLPRSGASADTSFAYSYQRAGADTALRQSVIDKANVTTAYGYDALERLTQARTTSASGSVGDDLRYAYDAVGNRTSETVRQNGLLGTSDVTTASSFNPADQLTNRGSVTYSYDANGNQSGSSAGQALAYNPADQTTSLKRAGGSALGAT
jgi:YD repeat-containing protein